MKIDLVTVLNKITTWIKTNGNREITGAQLNEILTDLIENPAQFQLKYGVPVDCIYNTGTFSGDKTRTLLTWQAVLNIMGGNKIPIIAPRVIADFPTDINTLHNYSIIANKHLDTGDTVLLSGQTNPAENGLYVIGENPGDTVRHELYPDAESLAGIIVTDVTGKMVVCGAAENGNMTFGAPMPEYDIRIANTEEDITALQEHATTPLTGLSLTVNKIVEESDTVVESIGYLQKQINDLIVRPPSIAHDNQNGYDYMGSALYGSSTSASVWTITRLLINNDGSATKTMAINVKWTDRLTANYQ